MASKNELQVKVTSNLADVTKGRITYTISPETKLEDLLKRSAEDTLVIGQVVIHRSENGLFSLNDLYDASGRVENKSPTDYFETVQGAKQLEKAKLLGDSELITRRGASGGTWASKRIAYNYASYLSDDFHDLVYETFESVQDMQITAVKDVAQNLLDVSIKTVGELAYANEILDFQEQTISTRVQERDAYKKQLAMTRSPNAGSRKSAAEAAADVLRNENFLLKESIRNGSNLIAFTCGSVEKLLRTIPKDSVKLRAELASAINNFSSAIEILNQEV